MQLNNAQKQVLRFLIQGDSWKVVMHILGERLAWHESQLQSISHDHHRQICLLERRNELLEFIARIYREAKEENPYSTANGALWATRFRLPEPDPLIKEEGEESYVSPAIPRRTGGSVA